MPVSVGDSRTFHEALAATSMCDVMETCARGLVDYAFLGGAQIDPYGNLNSTQIGLAYDRPDVRFPGSGGACDLASVCWRVIVVINHDPRRFVERVDFLTTPGYLDGPGAREAAGLPPGAGPYRVISDLAIMGFNSVSCRMEVLTLHEGVTAERVRAQTGFPIAIPDPCPVTAAPSASELRILRDQVDPHRYVIGRARRDDPRCSAAGS
jgi:glutaconate CoA-transferase subunit B